MHYTYETHSTLNTELEEPYIYEICIIHSLTLSDFLRLLCHFLEIYMENEAVLTCFC